MMPLHDASAGLVGIRRATIDESAAGGRECSP